MSGNSTPLYERPSLPLTARIAIAGMVGVVLASVILIIQVRFASTVSAPVGFQIAVSIAVVVMLGFLPSVGAVGVARGWRSAPGGVTVVGLWSSQELLRLYFFFDPLSFACASCGIAAAVCVWLAPSRRYGTAIREFHSLEPQRTDLRS